MIIVILLSLQGGLALRSNGCRLLAFEGNAHINLIGGGTKGAYQAGVFDELVKLLPPREIRYDVITGVSVGALNGLMVAIHKPGKEKEAASKLIDLWLNIQSSDIYEHWEFPGPVRGLFYKSSFFNNDPESHFVKKIFKENGEKVRRKFTVGITDAQTAKYFAVNQDVKAELIPYYVVASSSVPGFFKYLSEDNKILVDGSTVNNLNLREGIKECQNLVTDNSKITVDIIMTNPLILGKYDMTSSSSLSTYMRGNELLKMRQSKYYLFDIMRAFPTVNWRFIISPKKVLPNYPVIPLVSCLCDGRILILRC